MGWGVICDPLNPSLIRPCVTLGNLFILLFTTTSVLCVSDQNRGIGVRRLDFVTLLTGCPYYTFRYDFQ